jgi:DNA-binding MarR family transcriptional regulator
LTILASNVTIQKNVTDFYMKASSLKKLSHSELRHRILAALRPETASSVTSLAQKLGILRPSVSRSVSSLEEAGLIIRQERTISLSEAGQEELRRLDLELSAKVKKSTDLASLIMKQSAETREDFSDSSLSQLSETFTNMPLLQFGQEFANSPLLKFSEILANGLGSRIAEAATNSLGLQIVEAAANGLGSRIAEAATNSLGSRIVEAATNGLGSQVMQALEVINATAGIQTVNLGLLQNWKQEVFSPVNHLILENNMLLSNMMVDLEAITKIETTINKSLGNLISQTAWTTKIYDTYFLEVINSFKRIPTFDSLQLSLAIPTTGAAFLVGSTRRIVESETLALPEQESTNLYGTRTYASSERYVVLTPKLEDYLKPLGQHFIDKWEGAWQTLYSSGKDRHSQATHSGRELLMQVLAHLAPDSIFSKEECAKYGVNKPTRKMRIKHILGYEHKSSVDLIDSMANTLDRMYDVLVVEAHRRDGNNYQDDTIVGQLAALGSLLIMLLSMRSNIPS